VEAEKVTRVLCPFCEKLLDERKEKVSVERRELDKLTVEEVSDSPCSAARCRKAAKVTQEHECWKNWECYYVAGRKVWVGMSPTQAEASVGKPYKINRTSTAYGTTEQWSTAVGCTCTSRRTNLESPSARLFKTRCCVRPGTGGWSGGD